ncbi:Tripartite DNA replication factor [Entomortierella lignicola]|nr:Tripartite DNA replication factor [Entomortierella lignicola]
MSNVPKRKTTTNVSANSKAGNGKTFKKSASSNNVGSKGDTKMSQFRPSSATLTGSTTNSKPTPTTTPASTISTTSTTATSTTSSASLINKHSAQRSNPVQAPAPVRVIGTKARRTIIVEDDSDSDSNDKGNKAASGRLVKPLKRARAEKQEVESIDMRHTVSAPLPPLPKNEAELPFEERMPVSPPATTHDESTLSDQQFKSVNTPTKSLQENINDIEGSLADLTAAHVATTTPKKNGHQQMGMSPPTLGERPSPFRTPTEKSKHSHSTIESLGLSPQDSVFWVRTPPSEALKKLERMSSGRTHEEEIASIVGRLYETSSAGTALRTMAREPRDRIKDMLNTLRGSSTAFQSLDDELDDPERIDPVSPTKELVDRHRGNSAYRHRFARHQSAQELGSTSRRRGRVRASRFPNPLLSTQLTSPSKCREDVLKMIEQINSNMGRSVKPTDRPNSEDNIPSTPKRGQCTNTQSSPGEFDQLFTDLEMDVNDFEELTQLEFSSASMSSATSAEASTSCDSDNTLSFANKSVSSLPLELSGLDMKTQSNESLPSEQELRMEDPACILSVTSTNTEILGDDFGDIDDLGDDFDIEDGIMFDVLVAHDAKDSKVANIYLCDSWRDSRVVPGDIVHVISALIHDSEHSELMDLVLSDSQGLLIIKPDNLIPTSVLAESFNCIRKPIVDIRARKADESTIPLIHGTMLHELFQHALRNNDFSTESMESTVNRIIKMHLNDLCLVNESIETARESISQMITSCQDWANRYLNPTPTAHGKIDEVSFGGESSLLCINKVLDIEENIWSPMFGLKGKIDASIQIILKTTKKNARPDTAICRTLTVPFELKTGKKSNVVSHRAQTMLYTLLMTDRYDVDVRLGLLFYLKSGDFVLVRTPHDEIRTIIIQRNEIAAYEEDKLSLPPMIRNSQKCERCFSLSSCTTLHKLLENGTSESSGLGTMFEEVTEHLNETHAEFFRKWNRLISLEQGDVAKFQSQIWSMLSVDRQAAGNCLSHLVLLQEHHDPTITEMDADGELENSMSGRFARHRYRFKMGTPPIAQSQQTLTQTLRSGHSSLSSNISVGDPIVLSSEGQHYALAIGHVIDMTLSDIVVGLDRPLLGPPIRLDGYDQETNQSYKGLVDISTSSASTSRSDMDYHSFLEKNNITFRIDKDEMTAGIARTRNNLVQLFRADVHGGDSKRRHLVVDMDRPSFEPLEKFEHLDPHLNDDQRQAVEAVLSAKDYALILGMPGTGKSTTISQIIQTLVAQGKSVLITSYTHTAVDNVLLKLPSDINIVRLGNRDKVHRDIQKLVPDFSQPPVNTVEAIHNFYERCQVVGTTCLGIGDPLFTEKRFDYCIVDEASQITLPACLGPIRYADVFVLVGDHNQLPPLVKNVEAKKGGFDLSLFKLLSDQHPEAVTSLTRQYRMNNDIMLLSNTLVYENRLKCANEQVASKVLDIPSIEGFRKHCHSEASESSAQLGQCSAEQTCWLEQVLDPKRSVVFIDTDDLPAHEVQVGNSTQNPTEALLIHQLIEALTSSGISEENIGVISVLRAQLKILSRLLRARPLLDIHTVDRYQGRDKDCVIVSLVRSNSERHVGELLKDWRRINVAFTRAKKKLVVFGSRLTLQGSPVFEQFLRLMEQQNWVLKLAPQSQHQHPLLNISIPLKHTGSQNKDGSNARCNGTKSFKKNKISNSEDLDKENIIQGTDKVSADMKTVSRTLDKRDSGFEGDAKRKEPKVVRAKAEAVLKQMPITKNIIDSL